MPHHPPQAPPPSASAPRARPLSRPGTRALLPLLAAASLLTAPLPAAADGLNEWTGEAAGPGEFWFVPEGIFGVAGGPQVLYLQAQYGVIDKVDVIAYPILTLDGGELAEPQLEAYGRYSLTDTFMLAAGFNLPLYLEGDASVVLGLFHTVHLQKEVWKLTWNLLAWVPPTAAADSSLMGIVVLNRALGGQWTAFLEVDVEAGTGDPGAATVNLIPGVQYDLSDVDVLNFSLVVPVRPALEKAELGVGVWYGRGFGVK